MRMGSAQATRLFACLLMGVLVLAACGAGDADRSETPQSTSVEASVVDWVSDALRSQPGGHGRSLFFGAFYADEVFYNDETGRDCFVEAFLTQLANTGPDSVVDGLSQLASMGTVDDSSWWAVVELLNVSTYIDRVAIGDAAATAIASCGGLHERVMAMYAGPSLSSCTVEFADRHDVTGKFVAASIEMYRDPRAEVSEDSEAFFESLPWEDPEFSLCVEQFTQAGEPSTTTTGSSLVGDASAGLALYESTCSACHGPAGQGISGLGLPLALNPVVEQMTDSDFIAFSAIGRPAEHPDNSTGVDCPPLGGNPTLDETSLAQIFDYLQTLQ